MTDIAVILGLGIGSALLLGLAHVLGAQKDQEGNHKHPALRLLALLFFIMSLYFIPSHLLVENNYCEVVLKNISETMPGSANNLTYTYDRVCINNTSSISQTFYMFNIWFVRVFVAILTILFIAQVLMIAGEIAKMRRG